VRDICPKCGLLKEICACDILEKEDIRKIKVYATKKRFKKLVTVVEGLESDKLDECARELKHKLACGGTVKNGVIVLQGNHLLKMKALLKAQDYPEENIVVVPGIN
jgi:translation initiation factor 1